jgi:hypothetical protein
VTTGEKVAAVFLFAAALWIPFLMMVIEPLLLLIRRWRRPS